MVYAYAALKAGVPFANGAPNLTVDIPAIIELAAKTQAPVGGKDFKTGQTLMKTMIAPGLKARMLGLHGWFSTNILGNRDGEVLDDPESFKTKEESKLGVLEYILQPDLYPELYKDFTTSSESTTIRLEVTTRKVGTTSTSSAGSVTRCRSRSTSCAVIRSWRRRSFSIWLSSSISPSARACVGVQEWLSFYFKSPMTAPGLYPEHDLFIQLMKLKNTLRHLKGEELITHLGLEYYDWLLRRPVGHARVGRRRPRVGGVVHPRGVLDRARIDGHRAVRVRHPSLGAGGAQHAAARRHVAVHHRDRGDRRRRPSRPPGGGPGRPADQRRGARPGHPVVKNHHGRRRQDPRLPTPRLPRTAPRPLPPRQS